MINKIKKFFKKEKGQGLVEYGLILALISVLSIGAVSSVGNSVKDTFNNINTELDGLVVNDESDFRWVQSDMPGTYRATNEEGIGYYRYIGDEKDVVIPHVINGHPMTSYVLMFVGTDVEKVVSTNNNIIDMGSTFKDTTSDKLDLSSFSTRGTWSLANMFIGSKVKDLDISTFQTKHVMILRNTFKNSSIETLDLSSFDVKQATDLIGMFRNSKASIGYARSASDAEILNASPGKPAGLTFTVKP